MPSDLQYLTGDDIEELGMAPTIRTVLVVNSCMCTGGAMTRVEKMRLQSALQEARGKDPPSK